MTVCGSACFDLPVRTPWSIAMSFSVPPCSSNPMLPMLGAVRSVGHRAGETSLPRVFLCGSPKAREGSGSGCFPRDLLPLRIEPAQPCRGFGVGPGELGHPVGIVVRAVVGELGFDLA